LRKQANQTEEFGEGDPQFVQQISKRLAMLPVSILFGSLVGFALGLTGGGGSLLAVPLLVDGLAIAPREAF
jgi:hypothetical protein